MRTRIITACYLVALAALAAVVAACGSGTSTTVNIGPLPTLPPGPRATPVTTAVATTSPNGSATGLILGPSTSQYISGLTVAFGGSNTAGMLTVEGWDGVPAGIPPLTATVGPPPVVLAYVTVASSVNATFTGTPSFIVNLGSNANSAGLSYYVAYLAPGSNTWQQPVLGPATFNSALQLNLPPNLFVPAWQVTARSTYTYAIYSIPTPAFTDDWTSYAHDPQRTGLQTYGNGSSPLGAVTAANVSSLALAWSNAPNPACDQAAAANQVVADEASVLVANGLVYYADTCGYIAALNRETGATMWHYQTPVQNQVDGVLGTPVIDNGLLIVPIWGDPGSCTKTTLNTCDRANGGYLVALDAITGTLRWQTTPLTLGNLRGEPFALNGQIYQGVAGGDDTSGYVEGGIITLNEATGAQIGSMISISLPSSIYGAFNGGSSWTPVTYDGTNLYLGTGNTRDNLGLQDGVLQLLPQSGAVPVVSSSYHISTYDNSDTDEDVGGGILAYGGNLYFTGKNGRFYGYSTLSSSVPLFSTLISANSSPAGKGGIGTPTTDGNVMTVSSGYSNCVSANACTGSNLDCFTPGGGTPFAQLTASNSTIFSYAAYAKGVGFIGIDNGATDGVPYHGTPVLPEFIAFDDSCHILWKANPADVRGFFYGGPAVVASGVYAVDNAGNVYAWKLPYQMGMAARLSREARIHQTRTRLTQSTHFLRRHPHG